MRSVFLYGFGGAAEKYRVVRYSRIDEPSISISAIVDEAFKMRIEYPSIETVVAVDNRHGLLGAYRESIKKNSIESCAVFKDLIMRSGIEIK